MSTYVTELQGKALCGLELRCTQIHVFAYRRKLLLLLRLLLRLVHGWRQGEVKRAAGIIRLTHVHSTVTWNIFKPWTDFEEHLIVVLVDI